VGAVTPTGRQHPGRHRRRRLATATTAATAGQQRWVHGSPYDCSTPSARGTYGRFRAGAPTNDPARCLIVPSGLATRSTCALDSHAQIVPTSSDTPGVTGKTVNYFCPIVKGARNNVRCYIISPILPGSPHGFLQRLWQVFQGIRQIFHHMESSERAVPKVHILHSSSQAHLEGAT